MVSVPPKSSKKLITFTKLPIFSFANYFLRNVATTKLKVSLKSLGKYQSSNHNDESKIIGFDISHILTLVTEITDLTGSVISANLNDGVKKYMYNVYSAIIDRAKILIECVKLIFEKSH